MSYGRLRRNTRRGGGVSRRVPRNRKRANYFLLFCAFALSVVISGTVSFALRTPKLAVSEVRIQGVRLSDRVAVRRAGDRALGQNILLLRKSPILRLIGRLPEVKEVKIGRTFPDKVWVRVYERGASAVLTDGSRYCMVQDDGLMFHRTKGPVEGLALITIPPCERLVVGGKVRSQASRHALKVLTCARKEGLKLGKISVDVRGDICLNMGSDFYVKLGQPDDIASKMRLLRRVFAYKPSIANDAIYVDVSCPSAIVWKPKMVAQAAS